MKKDLLIAASVLATTSAFAQTSVTSANFANVTDTAANQTYDITGDITLGATNGGDAGDGSAADTEYILEGFTFVNPGATLTIEEGTIVRGQPFASGVNPGSLVVSRGGSINAVGTDTNPIIFTTAQESDGTRWDGSGTFLDADPATNPLPPTTSASATPNVALWGAVTLLGYAPTNRGDSDTGTPGEAYIEGFGLSNEQVTYGGRLPNDSSGTLEYVSIRHSGRAINEGDEQQGLTCGGVGAGTKIENIDVYCSVDDGIEVFGGTVGFKNVMISYVNDDGFDLDQGWTGNAQFVFILGSNLANNDGRITMDKGCEWDGDDGASDGTVEGTGDLSTTGQPFQNPTVYNMTIFANNAGGLIRCRNGFGGSTFNSLFYDAPAAGFRIDGSYDGSAEAFGYASTNPRAQSEAGTLTFAGNIFVGAGATVASTTIANDDWAEAQMLNDSSLALNAQKNDLIDGDSLGLGALTGGDPNVQDTANGVNPVPLASGEVTGTSNLVPVAGSFFDNAGYRGAFAPNPGEALWTTGWTAMNLRGILVDNGNGDSL